MNRKHERLRSWLVLSLYGELDDRRQTRLSEHLSSCPACRVELEELREFHRLTQQSRPQPRAQDLEDARSGLFDRLRTERYASGPAGKNHVSFFSSWWPWFRVPLTAAASIVLGLYLGYLSFATGSVAAGQDPLADPEVAISNVHFLDADASDGEVEISLETVRPIRLKGSLDDPRIRRVVTQALLNSQNAGVRMRAVSAVEERKSEVDDTQVKEALIKAVKSDGNAGVRQRALGVLQKMRFDQSVREALIYVLINDDNPGLRVAAVNALEGRVSAGPPVSQDLLRLLEERLKSEKNDFIRTRSQAFLEEVRFQ